MWQWHDNGVMWLNRFWILVYGAKLEDIKSNILGIISAWYDHNLLTYIFMPVWRNLCTNKVCKANGDQFSVWSGANF